MKPLNPIIPIKREIELSEILPVLTAKSDKEFTVNYEQLGNYVNQKSGDALQTFGLILSLILILVLLISLGGRGGKEKQGNSFRPAL